MEPIRHLTHPFWGTLFHKSPKSLATSPPEHFFKTKRIDSTEGIKKLTFASPFHHSVRPNFCPHIDSSAATAAARNCCPTEAVCAEDKPRLPATSIAYLLYNHIFTPLVITKNVLKRSKRMHRLFVRANYRQK